MSGEYQWNLQTFFPFITRKRGCNQPTDRKTALTVTAPFYVFLQTQSTVCWLYRQSCTAARRHKRPGLVVCGCASEIMKTETAGWIGTVKTQNQTQEAGESAYSGRRKHHGTGQSH